MVTIRGVCVCYFVSGALNICCIGKSRWVSCTIRSVQWEIFQSIWITNGRRAVNILCWHQLWLNRVTSSGNAARTGSRSDTRDYQTMFPAGDMHLYRSVCVCVRAVVTARQHCQQRMCAPTVPPNFVLVSKHTHAQFSHIYADNTLSGPLAVRAAWHAEQTGAGTVAVAASDAANCVNTSAHSPHHLWHTRGMKAHSPPWPQRFVCPGIYTAMHT